VAAALGESPGVFRRRLLLERAAYELANSDLGYGDPIYWERAVLDGA
jgi:hypothetical protein